MPSSEEMKHFFHLIALATLLFPSFAEGEETVEFPCTQATTLSMLDPDVVPNKWALLGLRNLSWSSTDAQHVLVPALEFADVSSIPETARVTSAVLKLTFYGRGSSPMKPGIRVYPITSEWVADTATWNDKPSWNEDFTEVEIPPEPNVETDIWEIDITPLVQKWVKGEIKNHGLVIVADSRHGDLHNFAFFGGAFPSSDPRAPLLTISFDANAQ